MGRLTSLPLPCIPDFRFFFHSAINGRTGVGLSKVLMPVDLNPVHAKGGKQENEMKLV
jgi:hypothetical protein